MKMMLSAAEVRAAEPRPGLRDLMRIGQDNDPFRQKARAAQLGFLSRYLPLNLLVTLCNALVVMQELAPEMPLPILLGWGVPQVAIMALWAYREVLNRMGYRAAITARRMRWLVFEMLLVGLGWGLLFAHGLYAAGGEAELLLVLAMAMAAIAITGSCTSIFPLGALVLCGPILAGTLLGISVAGFGGATIQIVLLTFMTVTVGSIHFSSRSFVARLHAEMQLTTQGEVVRLLLNEFEANGEEWLFEFDAEGFLTFATQRMGDAMERPVSQLLGRSWLDILQQAGMPEGLSDAVARSQPFRDMIVPVEVEDELRWWSLSATPKFDSAGRMCGYRGVGCDVTDRQRSAERIAELATFDALTGLVNRRIIHQALADGLASPDGVAVLFVDLDRFKHVNDSLGHGAGDRLLAEVAMRLREAVAMEAGARGLAGRLGGDEFAVVLRHSDIGRAMALGERIISTLSETYVLGSKTAAIGASLGLAVGPEDGESVEALMRAADLALYDVKANGRGSVRHFDRALHRQTEERRALEQDLRGAQAAGQLRLVYQPVVDALDERIVGFEALMRWRHPQRGEVPPALFIPMAEEAGLICALGRWALNEACSAAASWPPHVKFAVNLSPMQFDDGSLVEDVRSTLQRWCIHPSRLELELTESLFLDERPQTTEMLRQLLDFGVGFALDDFGTGYSSLGYLQKIAFSRIKIDRSFVQGSATDGGESTAIIQAIVALADRLGMQTTAEGTETRAEFEEMRRLGCAHVQGYYFGRPMPAEDAARLLDRARPLVELEEVVSPAAVPNAAADDGQWLLAGVRSRPLRRKEPDEPLPG